MTRNRPVRKTLELSLGCLMSQGKGMSRPRVTARCQEGLHPYVPPEKRGNIYTQNCKGAKYRTDRKMTRHAPQDVVESDRTLICTQET